MKRAILVFLYIILGLLSASLLSGCADQINATLYPLGFWGLTLVFFIGGSAAAIGFSVIGVKIIVGNAVGSSYRTTQGVLALVGAAAGLVIMLVGPMIAEQANSLLVDNKSVIPQTFLSPDPDLDPYNRSGQAAYQLLESIGNSVQAVVLYIGLVGCTVALSTIGVRIIIGSVSGSGHSISQGILALIGTLVGLILAATFSQIVWWVYTIIKMSWV